MRNNGGAGAYNPHVAAAWSALGASGYAIDKGVEDSTGVCLMDVASKLAGQVDQEFGKARHAAFVPPYAQGCDLS